MAVVNIANGFGSWRDCDIGSGAGVRRQFLEQHLETRVSECEADSGVFVSESGPIDLAGASPWYGRVITLNRRFG